MACKTILGTTIFSSAETCGIFRRNRWNTHWDLFSQQFWIFRWATHPHISNSSPGESERYSNAFIHFLRSTSWWEWLYVAVAHFVVHHTGSYGWGSALAAYANATFLSIACQTPQRHTSLALLGDGAAPRASSLSQCFIKQTRFCQPRFPYFSPSQMFPWLWQRSRQIAVYDLCWKWIRWGGRGGGKQMATMRKSDSW